jgi:hypothetical protein
MGRKGVSKRKPGQTKSKLSSSDNASGSVSSVVQAGESQPVTGKAVTSTRRDINSDRKKNPKKG